MAEKIEVECIRDKRNEIYISAKDLLLYLYSGKMSEEKQFIINEIKRYIQTAKK